jgi:hypothetical protein
VAEQEHVMGNKLSEEYMKDLKREKEVTSCTLSVNEFYESTRFWLVYG